MKNAHLSLVGRVLVSRWVDEVLLDGSHSDESGEDVLRTGLVVGSGSTGTAEWLLTNNGTGTLVVDVEVTSGVAELVRGDLES